MQSANYNQAISLLMGKEGKPELDLKQVDFRKLAETYMITRSIGGAMSGIHRIPIIMEAMYKKIIALEERIQALESGNIETNAEVEIATVKESTGIIRIYNDSELEAMTMPKIKQIAANLSVKTYSQSKKSLITAILNAYNEKE